MPEPFVSYPVNEAIRRATAPLLPPWTAYSAIHEVLFITAGTRVGIAHGLNTIPDGYLTILEVGGQVRALDVAQWTHERVFLTSTLDNTRARVIFFVARQRVLIHLAASEVPFVSLKPADSNGAK